MLPTTDFFISSIKNDLYAILGVEKNADVATINAAFGKLEVKHRPKGKKSNDTTEEFYQIQCAHEILSHHEERKVYDEQRNKIADKSARFWTEYSKILLNNLINARSSKDANDPIALAAIDVAKKVESAQVFDGLHKHVATQIRVMTARVILEPTQENIDAYTKMVNKNRIGPSWSKMIIGALLVFAGIVCLATGIIGVMSIVGAVPGAALTYGGAEAVLLGIASLALNIYTTYNGVNLFKDGRGNALSKSLGAFIHEAKDELRKSKTDKKINIWLPSLSTRSLIRV